MPRLSLPFPRECPYCVADLGPWEGDTCFTCSEIEPGKLSDPDAAVALLESEDGPIGTYDLWRGIRRDFGRNHLPRGMAFVYSDLRMCWAGKGIYGLYRHGLLPGARRLADVGQFLLLASHKSLSTPNLAFVMRSLGYRFQARSLDTALWNAPFTQWDGAGYVVENRRMARQMLTSIGVAPGRDGLTLMLARFQRLVDDALERRTAVLLDSRRLLAIKDSLAQWDERIPMPTAVAHFVDALSSMENVRLRTGPDSIRIRRAGSSTGAFVRISLRTERARFRLERLPGWATYANLRTTSGPFKVSIHLDANGALEEAVRLAELSYKTG